MWHPVRQWLSTGTGIPFHNSFETYWRGLLSHDFKENDTYRSAKVIGKEFAELGSHLVNLKKHNKVGFLVSNEAQTALDWFPIDGTAGGGGACKYNDVFGMFTISYIS